MGVSPKLDILSFASLESIISFNSGFRPHPTFHQSSGHKFCSHSLSYISEASLSPASFLLSSFPAKF